MRATMTAADELVVLLSDSEPHSAFTGGARARQARYRRGRRAGFRDARGRRRPRPYLRHAGVMALLGSGDIEAVWARANDPRASVRMAIVLVGSPACRSQGRQLPRRPGPRCRHRGRAGRLMTSPSMPRRPRSRNRSTGRQDSKRRAQSNRSSAACINANFRLGGPEQARAVAAFAADRSRPLALREEAIAALGDWSEPPSRDRVNGFWRPLPRRDPAVVRGAVEESYEKILGSTDGVAPGQSHRDVREAGRRRPWHDALEPGRRQVQRSRGTAGIASHACAVARTRSSITPSGPRSKATVRRFVRKLERSSLPSTRRRALPLLSKLLSDPTAPVVERQAALTMLAKMKTAEADAILMDWAKALASGRGPARDSARHFRGGSRARHARAAPGTRPVSNRVRPSKIRRHDTVSASRAATRPAEELSFRATPRPSVSAATRSMGPAVRPAPISPRSPRGATANICSDRLLEPDLKLVPGYETVALESERRPDRHRRDQIGEGRRPHDRDARRATPVRQHRGHRATVRFSLGHAQNG